MLGNQLCEAGIVVSTLGPNGTFDPDVAQPISVFGGEADRMIGQSFEFNGSDVAVDSVTAPFSWLPIPFPTNQNSGVTLEIRESENGLPGAVLEQASVGSLSGPAEVIGDQVLTTFSFSGTTRLSAGATYFLTASSQNLGSFYGWLDSDPALGLTAPLWSKSIGSDWIQSDSPRDALAFEIQGHPVPEPSSLALTMVGVGTVVARRRRNLRKMRPGGVQG